MLTAIPAGVYSLLINQMVYVSGLECSTSEIFATCKGLPRDFFVQTAKRWHKLNIESDRIINDTKPDYDIWVPLDYKRVGAVIEKPLLDMLVFAKWLYEISENIYLSGITERRKLHKTEEKALEFLDSLLFEALVKLMEEDEKFTDLDVWQHYYDNYY